jgi:aspartyl-tRNA(Asn)/glutamyl-tRNA(Gln) amidotransferase subunit C
VIRPPAASLFFHVSADSPNLALGKPRGISMLPAMPHSHIDVRYVANLARLELTDEEVATFQPQLEAILRHVDAISGLDVAGIEPTAHPAAVFGRMRDDEPHQNAPDHAQGQIRVPKVVADA